MGLGGMGVGVDCSSGCTCSNVFLAGRQISDGHGMQGMSATS